MLKVQGLVKTFKIEKDSVQAVRGVSFELQPGEFYSLLGPSGCGKTTTLRCVAGLEFPNEGDITIDDTVVYSESERIQIPPYRRSIGMVFQSYAIWPHMNVFDNVAYPIVRGRYRIDKKEVKGRVMEALDRVQLGALADRWAVDLSGGQQQRVALARALVHRPALLLLDEPLSNLDAKLREDTRVELKQVIGELGLTTLYVTHDQLEALAMSDRIAVMRDGQIVQEGSPLEIYTNPTDERVAKFVGRTNMFSGRVIRMGDGEEFGSVETAMGQLKCHVPPQFEEGAAVEVAFRPEAVVLNNDSVQPMDNSFPCSVEAITFLGDHIDCTIEIGNGHVLASINPFESIDTRSQTYAFIPPERLVVFHQLGDAAEAKAVTPVQEASAEI